MKGFRWNGRWRVSLALGALLLGGSALEAFGHDVKGGSGHRHEPLVLAQVTPEEEKRQAAEMEAEGPSETTGIENVRLMGTVPLAGQIDSVDGYMLRAREIDVAPGGVVAVHRHDGRPGVAYIVSGEMTEHRAGTDGPVVKKAGDTAFEESGTIHWWENEGDTTARAIVVDLVPVE